MYKPVIPVVLVPNAQDKRPVGGPWLFSARCHGVAVPPENWTVTLYKVKLPGRRIAYAPSLVYCAGGAKNDR
jgi:hypothetical protein